MVGSRILVAWVLLLSGCRMGVPVSVWQPAQLESTVGKRVAIGNVTGPKEIADPIRTRMLTMAPQDAGRNMTAIDPAKMQAHETIRLVSGTNDVNDIALASVARREGVDYVLRGQVISRRESTERAFDPNEPLAVSWRLMSVPDDRHVGGVPVVVDLKTAMTVYPDLAMVGDPAEALATAAVRETYRLMAPSIVRERVQLAIPYAIPGSKEVRRGNALAMAGRWGEAEQVWQAALENHPSQTAAIHNLALAAAAGQDFSLAKALARRAIRRQPTELHKQTLVWIERMQRKYHTAFNLPDPPEGWFVTNE